jgi:ABC-type dipeptide/oligopeptide/nickel transport system ATPase component
LSEPLVTVRNLTVTFTGGARPVNVDRRHSRRAPDLSQLPPGCSFAPRCKHARPECAAAVPDNVALGARHAARCVLVRPAVAA